MLLIRWLSGAGSRPKTWAWGNISSNKQAGTPRPEPISRISEGSLLPDRRPGSSLNMGSNFSLKRQNILGYASTVRYLSRIRDVSGSDDRADPGIGPWHSTIK